MNQKAKLRQWIAVAAVLAVAGCSLVSQSDGPVISTSLNVGPTGTQPLRLVINIDGRQNELFADEANSWHTALDVNAVHTGAQPVTVMLRAANGDSLAGASFTENYQSANSYWIAGVVNTRRPVGFCLGAVIVRPLAGRADTLFILHGGLPNGAIC